MKVAYIDLTLTDFYEHYSVEPNRYGGGRVFASWLKQFPEFFIFAPQDCFSPISELDRKSGCIHISLEQRSALSQGYPVSQIIPNAAEFDIFIHINPSVSLNLSGLKGKELVWLAGVEQPVNPNIERIALYNEFQNPKLSSNPKIFKFQLGYPIKKFVLNQKEDFIFQCSRHVPAFNSCEIASFCLRHKIKGIFAGPIPQGYPLYNFIDNINTFYLGEISEKDKIDYTSKARLYTLLHNWPTPFSLSAIESLSCGTPIACTAVGFWPTLIKHNYNGFIISNEDQLLEAFKNAATINQSDCYISALKYNVDNMISSVWYMLQEVLNS